MPFLLLYLFGGVMAYFQRLIVAVLVLLSAWVPSAYAETIAAASTGPTIPTVRNFSTYGYGGYDINAACVSLLKAYYGTRYWGATGVINADKVDCSGREGATGASTFITSFTYKWQCSQFAAEYFDNQKVASCPSSYICPTGQNWSVSGSSCVRPTCTPLEIRNPANGLCVPDTSKDDACTDQARLSLLAPKQDYDLVGSVGDQTLCLPSPTSPAGAGCKSAFAVGAKYTKPDGSSVTNGELTPAQGSGSSCVLPTTPIQPTPNPCPDGQPGTVNGKTVCLAYPPGTSKETVEKVTKSDTATGPAGAASSASSSTSVTSCIGDGACTTTTTTTGTSGGAAVSGTSTKTQSKDSFCAENPSSAQCSEGGVSDGGLGGLPELYKAKYPAGIGGVWTAKKSELMASPLMSVGNKLMPSIGSGGVCPVFTLPLDIGPWSFGNADLSPACWLWDIGKAFTIIGALLLARALIFGG